ncbi:hypothetical protein ACJX0J_024749 [Zea mays]
MRKRMESVDDLIEEAKLCTVWWALCIFAVSYFLTREGRAGAEIWVEETWLRVGCVGDVAWAVCPGDRRGGAGPARRRGCRRSRRGDPDPDDLERA